MHRAGKKSLSERQECRNGILRKEAEIEVSETTLAQRLGM